MSVYCLTDDNMATDKNRVTGYLDDRVYRRLQDYMKEINADSESRAINSIIEAYLATEPILLKYYPEESVVYKYRSLVYALLDHYVLFCEISADFYKDKSLTELLFSRDRTTQWRKFFDKEGLIGEVKLLHSGISPTTWNPVSGTVKNIVKLDRYIKIREELPILTSLVGDLIYSIRLDQSFKDELEYCWHSARFQNLKIESIKKEKDLCTALQNLTLPDKEDTLFLLISPFITGIPIKIQESI